MISKWLSAGEIAQFINRTDRAIRWRAEREHWVSRLEKANGGTRRIYHVAALPEDIQTAYAASLKVSLSELQTQLKPVSRPEAKGKIVRYNGRSEIKEQVKSFDACSDAERGIALLRKQIIDAYDGSGLSVIEFIRHYEAGVILPEVKERLGRWGLIHTPSKFYAHWLSRYSKFGIEGLVPQYKDKGGPGASLTQEMKDRIEWLYLDSSKPAVPSIVENLAQYGMELNGSTVRRYIKTIPAPVVAMYRYGQKYFHDKCETFIQRDYTKYKSMDIICGDYMTEDMLCRIGERKFRAKLCAFEDMRSRKIVGWSLQLTANSVGVVRSLKMAFENHGLAGKVYVDNGREFKNFWLCGDEWKLRRTKIDPESLEQDAGILNECGVKVAFCQPYHGQSKPIERFWGTFHERFDKFIATYLGSNTTTKPEEAKLYTGNISGMEKADINLIPTFEQIETMIGNFMNWYNAKWKHSGQGMNDRTPDEVFAENFTGRRELPEQFKKYLFTMRYVKTVTRNGVEVDGASYYTPEMQALIGQKVEVRRGLDNAGKVHIFGMPDRKYLFDAEDLAWSGIVEEDIKKVKKLRREAKELYKGYNRRKAEFDKGEFKTPAEIYAAKNTPFTKAADALEDTREVSGGEPLATIKRRLRLPTDPD
ncbi:MAG: Mu transposase C-terminal domain-containing protein [Spirochaetaceae bacterium]|jgi:putative transposase|nr:Mu transposase C-terminal domain-containing protein [Spirochaetaceae bacterium]